MSIPLPKLKKHCFDCGEVFIPFQRDNELDGELKGACSSCRTLGVETFYPEKSIRALLEEIEKRMVEIEKWVENIHLNKPSTEHLTWLGLINQTAEVTKEQIREVRNHGGPR